MTNAAIARLRDRKRVPAKSRTPVFANAKAMSITLQGNPNWVAAARWANNTGSPISSFEATWVVPPPPANPNQFQTIYLFIGVGNPSFILQPILVWLPDDQGVGNWFVGGMIATGQNKFPTINGKLQVDKDTPIRGIISVEPANDGNFIYTCQIDQYPGTLTRTNAIPELTNAYVALESYDISDSSYYPPIAATTVRNIQISTQAGAATPGWLLGSPGPLGEHAELGNQGNGPDIILNY
jgi:hypothetical protein